MNDNFLNNVKPDEENDLVEQLRDFVESGEYKKGRCYKEWLAGFDELLTTPRHLVLNFIRERNPDLFEEVESEVHDYLHAKSHELCQPCESCNTRPLESFAQEAEDFIKSEQEVF